MIEKSTDSYGKLEKGHVTWANVPSFPFFFLQIPQRIGLHGKTEKVVEHLATQLSPFPSSHKN